MSNPIERFAEIHNAAAAERDRMAADAQKAEDLFRGIFDRIPGSKDEQDRLVTCVAPRFQTPRGLNVQLDQTNYSFGSGACYNLSVIDDKDISHAYAQVRPGRGQIGYWDVRDNDRLIPGSARQDREVIKILEQADTKIT